VAVNRLEEKDRTGQDRTGQGNRQLAIAAKVDVWNLQKKNSSPVIVKVVFERQTIQPDSDVKC